MDIQKMEYCARCSQGNDIYAEHISSIPARQLHAKDAVKHQLPSSLTLFVKQWRAKMLAREQCYDCEWQALEKHVVFSIGCQKSRVYFGIIKERLSGIESDFLEMNNVRKLGSLQNIIKNELGTCNGP